MEQTADHLAQGSDAKGELVHPLIALYARGEISLHEMILKAEQRSAAAATERAKQRARWIVERTPLQRSNHAYWYGARWQQLAELHRLDDPANWIGI